MKVRGTTKSWSIAALVAGMAIGTGGQARAGDELSEAFALTKPILDMRLRYEGVDQVPLAKEANAVTLRTRAGFETGKAWGTSILVEGEWVAALHTDYNSSINGKVQFPAVSDPKALELNRLQISNISIPSTAITLGRQRINLDDQRFVGGAAWRQNEQTFDALRIVNKSIDGLTIDAMYMDRVNRVFGPDSAQGHYDGDTFLVNAAYVTPLGKLTAFAYLMQFDRIPGFTAERNSSQTYGARFTGTRDLLGIKWGYAASYATQKQYDNNPLRYATDYYLVDLTALAGPLSGGVGYEVLGGNGVKGFTTPLATLHKFQGWADKFLTTPPNGIEDVYASLGYTQRNLGPFSSVAATVIYHRFDASHISLHYGDETNWQLQAKWNKFTFTFKYADYRADRLFTNTQKLWLQGEYVF